MKTLVTGGIRSGKSAYAEGLLPVEATYLATGPEPTDADESWARRVLAHQERRLASWRTVESADAAAVLATVTGPVLLDDAGSWLTTTLDELGAWDSFDADAYAARQRAFVDAVRAYPDRLVIVTSEVGLTLVATTPAGRRYADLLGTLNQALAQACDTVTLVIAGCPLNLKESH